MFFGDLGQQPKYQDWGLFRAGDWHLHFCLWPRTCFLTGKQLWFKRCYKGTYQVTNRGETIQDVYHIDKHEFIIWNLTK
jgi:hypothetical protein